MTIVVIIAATLLTAAAVLSALRTERGPSMLDRMVGLDVMTSVIVGAIALEAAWSRRTDTVPILVVLAMVGFVASVTIARFAAAEPEGAGRILTREEIAVLESKRLAAEDAERVSTDDEDHGGAAPGELTR